MFSMALWEEVLGKLCTSEPGSLLITIAVAVFKRTVLVPTLDSYILGIQCYVHPSLQSSGRVHVVQDRPCEIVRGAVAAHVSSPRFAIIHISSCRLIAEVSFTLL